MAVYWLTFRIHNATIGSRTYEDRYEALDEMVRSNCSRWWKKPTSFIAFESAHSIDALASKFAGCISKTYDMFLIRAMDTKSAYICGANDDNDIYDLMPYLEKYS